MNIKPRAQTIQQKFHIKIKLISLCKAINILIHSGTWIFDPSWYLNISMLIASVEKNIYYYN